MINETDLVEYYELLDKKQEEYRKTHEPLLQKQIELIKELVRIQKKILRVQL